jgi:hypothetical protein
MAPIEQPPERDRQAWAEFFRAHFMTILLFVLIIVLISVLLHVSHHTNDAGVVAWAREQTTGAIGAFLGLITGAKLMQSKQ